MSRPFYSFCRLTVNFQTFCELKPLGASFSKKRAIFNLAEKKFKSSSLGLSLYTSITSGNTNDKTMNEFEVIIIGAGVAGVAAATKLAENAFTNFLVLEASNRIGGRVHSVRFGQGVVDLGAEWVHGQKGNVVYDMAKPLDLLFQGEQFFPSSKFVRSDGTTMDPAVVNTLFEISDAIYDNLPELQLAKGSFGAFFEEKYWGQVKPLLDEGVMNKGDAELFLVWAEKMYSSIIGSAVWGDVSVTENTEYKECEGNQLQIWKQGGYSTVLDLLLKNIPDPNTKVKIEEKIMFNKEVKLIDWQNLHVEITCTDGSRFRSRRVICTASLGVLKAKADLFRPSLPFGHRNAIKGLQISVIDKIFLEFPYHWWPVGAGGISCIWTPEDLKTVPNDLSWTTKVFGFYRNDSQPLNVLCGWVGGEAAAFMETLSEAELKCQCMALLRRFSGTSVKIPEPLSILRSSWHTNPHTRGSYSYRTIESDESNSYPKALASPVCNSSGEPTLMFAGEATSDRYFSTVHGAIETGWREADRILRIRNPQCCSVAVVGAGIAGLAAASALVASGVDAVVLEAQSVVGGRIWSVPTKSGWIELGAQWLHGENTAVYQIAAGNGLLSSQVSVEGLGRYCRADGSFISPEIVEEVAEVMEHILESCEQFHECLDYPKSVGEELETRFSEYLSKFPAGSQDFIIRQELFEWHKRFLLIDNSCDTLRELSAKAWGIYENCGGKHCINFKRCYRELIDTIVADLPADIVKMNSPVRCIEWCQNENAASRVKVWGDSFVVYADHVIVTSSLGYLKKHRSSLFKPPLPSPLSQAIDLLGFATLVKLYVLYVKPWWSANDEGFQLVWTRNDELEKTVPWVCGVQGFDVMPGRPILLCWVGGPETAVLEKTSEIEIAHQVTLLLHQFTGNHEIPKPSQIYRSKWHENEYVLGAYSHVTPACDALNINHGTLQTPVFSPDNNNGQAPTLLLAGEACSLRHYSTVHGAFESGLHQAEVIIDYIKNRKC